ncbi:alcohol acetyltransferase [Pyrenochaeta sp. MPI-SDFR-AT-0127]|nr:alcohol acetyltransferase [Pyrenochaeta sp. MPI-SDFR-AT-0127]
MAATKSHAGSKIRSMGCHESYQLAIHTLNQYRGTMVACRYFPPAVLARSDSLATLKVRFYDALTRVVLAQPHLQTGIIGENSKNPAFVRLDHLDLRHHVQWITLDESSHFQQLYLETIQAQLDSRYENLSTQPGWRLVVLHEIGAESIEVMYVWNHTHHDGSSAKIFHQYLLRFLTEINRQGEEPIVDASDADRWIINLPDSSDRLPPNPEILTPWPVSPGFVLSELWKGLKPEWIFPRSDTHARWAPIQASPYQTRFRNFTVDSQLVTKLVGACRLHHTTLTGLVQALCLTSLSTALQDARGFASRTPYDLRQILPSNTTQYPWLRPKESMCNYVSVVDHEFDSKLVDTIRSHMRAISSNSKLSTDVMDVVWSVSARVRREIQARLDSGTRNDLIGIMKLCPDWNSQQESEMRKTRCLSWLVTNLGVLDGECSTSVKNEEMWSLRRAELILSADTPSAAFSVSMMTVKGREMCITCSWQDCVVEAELGERLMGDLERWLKAIGS